jgi:hypothetical protein
MNYLAILKGLIAIVHSFANYLNNKQLIDAGIAQATLEGLKDVQIKIAMANDAVRDVDSLPISEDTANRANTEITVTDIRKYNAIYRKLCQ